MGTMTNGIRCHFYHATLC